MGWLEVYIGWVEVSGHFVRWLGVSLGGWTFVMDG